MSPRVPITIQLASTVVLSLGMWAGTAGAHEFTYRYVPVDEATLPEGVLFFDPVAVNDSGEVHGVAVVCTSEACETALPQVAVYRNGAVKIRVGRPSLALVANATGTVGGSLLTDPEQFIEQAALFHGSRIERIPRLPGEFTSWVIALSDSGSALVTSFDAEFNATLVLYENGESTVLDFGPQVANPWQLAINSRGIISGTQGGSFCDGSTGFRFNPRSGNARLLQPIATDPAALALDVNNRSHVLGYSFVCSGRESIGVWDNGGRFRTYFVEGTEEFPTISNDLLFNDENLIVITNVSSPAAEESRVSYLVPEPGVRLNLAELVRNLPAGVNLSIIRDINNQGDMIGFDALNGGNFLLKRIDGSP